MTGFSLIALILVLLFGVALGYLLGTRQKAGEKASMQAELRQIASDMARTESSELRRLHRDTLLEMLDPLDQDLRTFHKLFIEGNTQVKTSVEALVKQTQSVGEQAEELTRALRGNSKLQGNWGEGILENLLEASGLRRDEDFVRQPHYQNGRLIPDVVIHLPEERCLIVDAKVSLTAFVRYANAKDAEEQERELKAHVESVKQHVRELADKHYDRHVPGAVGHVLMFIPNEAAYVAAVTADSTLNMEAYKRHVILLNPANLLMALQLVHNLWQQERQSKNVQEIYASAERLYKKFALFGDNFLRLGQGINQLRRTYEAAENQLTTGRGNIVSQLESWKERGLNTSAEIRLEAEAEDEEDDGLLVHE